MTRPLPDDQVRLLRAQAQRLDARTDTNVASLLHDICGVQAQDSLAAALAIRVRSRGLTAAEVDRALTKERTIVRTWCMRGTLHLLAMEDLDWLLELHGPVIIAKSQRRYQQLGLDSRTITGGIRALREILGDGGALTRDEIVKRLASRRLHLVGQAGYHLLRRAALERIVCFGPEREGEPTYVLLEHWRRQGPSLTRRDALALLARRYLEAYGPAGPADLASWSGLPLHDVREGWHGIVGQATEVTLAGQKAWMLKSQSLQVKDRAARSPEIRLIPRFDTYLLGYRSGDITIPRPYAKRVQPGGGLVHPTLLIDGLAAGTWRFEHRRNVTEVVVEPFERLPRAVKPGIVEEISDIGRFLDKTTRPRISPEGS